jgi:integrase
MQAKPIAPWRFGLRSKNSDRVVRHTLVDGSVKEYRYGPHTPTTPDILATVVARWQRSPEWMKLDPGTQRNYVLYIKPLHEAFKLRPIAEIERPHILTIRDEIAFDRGHGAALNFCRAAGVLFSWAFDRGLIKFSPAIKLSGALERGHLPAWRDDQAQRAMRELPEPYRRAVVLAYHTGQRRGDLCKLRWTDYDEAAGVIHLTQQKTAEPMQIPLMPELRTELAVWKADRRSITILEHRGKPWRPSYLTQELPDHLARIGLPRELGLHGLRRLTAIRLAEAGCSTNVIAAITGHRTLQMVQEYTRGVRQRTLADVAILHLQKAGQKSAKGE